MIKKYKYSFNMFPYIWSARYATNADVLDLGCGEGYCLVPLSVFAKSITGIDRNRSQYGKPTLDICRENQYFCPATFIEKDLEKEEIGINCDVCLAFEILEHLENPEKVVAEMSKRCKWFIFSVPKNYPETAHKQMFYSLEDAKKLVEPHFKNIDWYYFRNGHISKTPFDVTQRFIGVCSN